MIQTIGDFLYNILDAVGSVLPRDPFLQFFQLPDAVIYKYLGVINWFVPVSFFVSTFEVFFSCLWLLYYYFSYSSLDKSY